MTPNFPDKKIVAIIPARGGSKSVPKKNIKLIGGKPLLAWTVAFAKNHPDIARVIVSTEDEEIVAVAKTAGAEVPFVRPAELALDTTPTLPVLVHCLEELKKEQYVPDAIILLEPTSLYRNPDWISEALKLFFAQDADSVVAVGNVPSQFNVAWQCELGASNELTLLNGKSLQQVVTRRQDLTPSYYRNGAFYIIRPSNLEMAQPSLYGTACYGYPVDESSVPVIDINTLQDWEYAEYLVKKYHLL